MEEDRQDLIEIATETPSDEEYNTWKNTECYKDNPKSILDVKCFVRFGQETKNQNEDIFSQIHKITDKDRLYLKRLQGAVSMSYEAIKQAKCYGEKIAQECSNTAKLLAIKKLKTGASWSIDKTIVKLCDFTDKEETEKKLENLKCPEIAVDDVNWINLDEPEKKKRKLEEPEKWPTQNKWTKMSLADKGRLVNKMWMHEVVAGPKQGIPVDERSSTKFYIKKLKEYQMDDGQRDEIINELIEMHDTHCRMPFSINKGSAGEPAKRRLEF